MRVRFQAQSDLDLVLVIRRDHPLFERSPALHPFHCCPDPNRLSFVTDLFRVSGSVPSDREPPPKCSLPGCLPHHFLPAHAHAHTWPAPLATTAPISVGAILERVSAVSSVPTRRAETSGPSAGLRQSVGSAGGAGQGKQIFAGPPHPVSGCPVCLSLASDYERWDGLDGGVEGR